MPGRWRCSGVLLWGLLTIVRAFAGQQSTDLMQLMLTAMLVAM